jgi:thiamine biosynthesis protein ThiS
MFVIVNGQTQKVTEPNTLAELLRSLVLTTPFAIARNNEFVPRAAYDQCRLAAGDRIDIVHPTVGG